MSNAALAYMDVTSDINADGFFMNVFNAAKSSNITLFWNIPTQSIQ